MIEINAAFQDNCIDLGLLGRADEGKTRSIVFDCKDILDEYPDAKMIAVITQPCTGKKYSVSLSERGTDRILTIERSDTAYPGILNIELRAIIDDDGNKRKSAFYKGKIEGSMIGEGDAPGAPVRDMLDRAEERLERLSNILADFDEDRAKWSAPADWNQQDTTATDYIKNRPGAYSKTIAGTTIEWDGEAGDRVSIPVSKTDNVVKVSDVVLTKEELTGAAIKTSVAGTEREGVISESDLMTIADGLIMIEGLIWIVSQSGDYPFGKTNISFPETGVYFTNMGGKAFPSYLKVPDQSEFVKIPHNYVEEKSDEEKLQELIDADMLCAVSVGGEMLALGNDILMM